ncbi:MAG: ABC transporter permease subunit [Eggerthellaceae bacterium]|nr:ABC transporter permease subunit [Eggerthellaceae bacterium]
MVPTTAPDICSSPTPRRLAAAFACLALACALVLSAPLSALALDTAKCTARPNGSTGSEVYGGTETRLTWEGQADADEAIAGLSITFPQGSTFGTDDARITMLSGEKLMDRTIIEADLIADGETFTATFKEPAPAGGYFRVEIYEVYFPTSGGEMAINGTYTLEDGTSLPVEDITPLTITGVSGVDQITSYLADQEWVQAWNSNRFLRMFFNPVIIVDSFPIVFQGFLMAVAIVAVAFPIAIPIGLCLSLMRMAKFRLLRGLASLYVNVVRGTPLFLQIYIAFFGLPLAGLSIDKFPLGVIVLSMNSAAYLCEIFRAGIQSIPRGQSEAARSLGMNGAQTMIFVIIPQTVRRVIPTMTSEFILLYKDTSMLAAVGVMEVVMYAKTIVASTGSITPYIVAACFYLVITLPLAKIVGRLEARLAGEGRRRKRPAPPAVGTPPTGTDARGVTAYVTDALTSQPVLKNDDR